MSKKGMQVGKDGRVKGLPGLMEQLHSSTSGSQGGRRGRRDGQREGGYRMGDRRSKVDCFTYPGRQTFIILVEESGNSMCQKGKMVKVHQHSVKRYQDRHLMYIITPSD